MSAATAWLLAHQGGWDEALLVATPIALFVLLLRIANARAARAEEQERERDQERDRGHEPVDR